MKSGSSGNSGGSGKGELEDFPSPTEEVTFFSEIKDDFLQYKFLQYQYAKLNPIIFVTWTNVLYSVIFVPYTVLSLHTLQGLSSSHHYANSTTITLSIVSLVFLCLGNVLGWWIWSQCNDGKVNPSQPTLQTSFYTLEQQLEEAPITSSSPREEIQKSITATKPIYSRAGQRYPVLSPQEKAMNLHFNKILLSMNVHVLVIYVYFLLTYLQHVLIYLQYTNDDDHSTVISLKDEFLQPLTDVLQRDVILLISYPILVYVGLSVINIRSIICCYLAFSVIFIAGSITSHAYSSAVVIIACVAGVIMALVKMQANVVEVFLNQRHFYETYRSLQSFKQEASIQNNQSKTNTQGTISRAKSDPSVFETKNVIGTIAHDLWTVSQLQLNLFVCLNLYFNSYSFSIY